MTLNELEAVCNVHLQRVRLTSLAHLDGQSSKMVLKLIEVARAASSLMSEDGAREALAHYNCLHILADKLKELE